MNEIFLKICYKSEKRMKSSGYYFKKKRGTYHGVQDHRVQTEKLFHFFEDVCAVPRGSGHEKGISDFLVKFAKDRGLWVYQDDSYNVIIKKKAARARRTRLRSCCRDISTWSATNARAWSMILRKRASNLVLKTACSPQNGTTLGADNGVAIALMMMVLDDDEIKHPPVECVFTTEEEVGLNGAQALDKSQITARTMINMDSEEEGVATISCAGGLRVQLTRKVERTAAEGTLVQVKIEGLLGGHSGTDIDKERQNANILMARMVDQIMKNTDGKLVTFAGGTKDNAITRECAASLIYAEKAEAEKAEKLATELAETFADEISAFEPDFACEVSAEDNQSAAALKDEDAKAFIGAIRLAPERCVQTQYQDGRLRCRFIQPGCYKSGRGRAGDRDLSAFFRGVSSGGYESAFCIAG